MFRPYRSLIVSEDNLPNDDLERAIAYNKRVKECERELRKDPQKIISILKNNREAYNHVFERLAKCDFSFYKWLQHPLILDVKSIVQAFRHANKKDSD